MVRYGCILVCGNTQSLVRPLTQPRLTPDLIRALFAETLDQEFGLRLPVEAQDQGKANGMISQTMKNSPDRERVMICAFPEIGELWFVKKTVEVIT